MKGNTHEHDKLLLDAKLELLQRDLEDILERERSILAKKKQTQKAISVCLNEMLDIKQSVFSRLLNAFNVK